MARDLGGKVVGAYRLGEVIGRGRTSTVYEAEHAASGRKVAVKVFSSDFARDKNAAARLVSEVQKATAPRHPNLVEVIDVAMVEQKGKRHLYLVLSRLRGESLAARLKGGKALPLDVAMRIASDVGAAIHAVHRDGHSHRTLDAGAVFLSRDGEGDGEEERVQVLDLGRAAVLAADPSSSASFEEDDTKALALLVQEMLGGIGAPAAGAARPVLPLRLRNREVPVHVDVALRRALGEGGVPFPSVAALLGALLGGGDLLPVCGVWSEDGALSPPSGRSGVGVGWLAVCALAVLGGGIGLWLWEGPRPLGPPVDLVAAAPDLLSSSSDLTAPGNEGDGGAVAADLVPPADLTAPADLSPPPLRPKRTGPALPPVRGPVDFNPELKAAPVPTPAPPTVVAPAAAPVASAIETSEISKPKRQRRTGPPIPPLRP